MLLCVAAKEQMRPVPTTIWPERLFIAEKRFDVDLQIVDPVNTSLRTTKPVNIILAELG